MRRRPGALGAAVSLCLVLAACGGELGSTRADVEPKTPSADAADPLADVTAGTCTDGKVCPVFPLPLSVDEPVARVDAPGTGDVIEADHWIDLSYATVSGEDGSWIARTSQSPMSHMPVADATLSPAVRDALIGQRAGVTIVAAEPEDGGFRSLVTLLQVHATYPVLERATGTPAEPVPGLPTVTLLDDGAPLISEIPRGTPSPTEVVVAPLVVGDGPVVGYGPGTLVRYSSWDWDSNASYLSNWHDAVPTSLFIHEYGEVTHWEEALVGQTVGSQVMVVVPKSLGYPADPDGVMAGDVDTGTAAIVVVVDILSSHEMGDAPW